VPVFVQQTESAYNSTAVSIDSPAFDVIIGDLVVAIGMLRANTAGPTATLTISDNTGAGLTWTQQELITTPEGVPRVGIWTHVVESEIAGLVVTMTRDTAVTQTIAVNVLTFRAGEVGTSESAAGFFSLPQRVIATSSDDSAVMVVIVDNAAADGSSRAWLAGAGTITELTYFRTAALWAVYVGVHDNAGVTGSYTVGLSTPSGQNYSLGALEIIDVADPPTPEQTDVITHNPAS
jgi:hypothetical protein